MEEWGGRDAGAHASRLQRALKWHQHTVHLRSFVCRNLCDITVVIMLGNIDEFVWVPGVTLLSSYSESAVITASYLFVIYSIEVSPFT